MSLRNRKGDVTITTVILIVLGLAVLVMLIVGFTKGWDFFFGIFDSGPSELQTVAKACLGYAQASLTIDFCKYRLIEENGKDEIVNCNDGRILQSLNDDGVNLPASLTRCSNSAQDLQTVCGQIADSKRGEVKVNGAGSCASVNLQSIVIDKSVLTISEDTSNNKGKIKVHLSSAPVGDAVLSVTSSDTSHATVSPTSLTFTSDNFGADQEITVTSVTDSDTATSSVIVQISGSALGVTPRNVIVTVLG